MNCLGSILPLPPCIHPHLHLLHEFPFLVLGAQFVGHAVAAASQHRLQVLLHRIGDVVHAATDPRTAGTLLHPQPARRNRLTQTDLGVRYGTLHTRGRWFGCARDGCSFCTILKYSPERDECLMFFLCLNRINVVMNFEH